MRRSLLVAGLVFSCGFDGVEANRLQDLIAGIRARLFGQPAPYPGGFTPGVSPSGGDGSAGGSGGGGGGFLPNLGGLGNGGYTYTTLWPAPPPVAPAPVAPEDFFKTTTTGAPPSTSRLPGTPADFDVMPEKQMLKTAPWSSPNVNAQCGPRFVAPPAPKFATDYNGVKLPDVCFTNNPGPHHVFAVGDWGGMMHDSGWIQPADHRSKMFGPHHRPFILHVDDMAQKNVAAQMAARAAFSNPDYVLNVGDNFYWAGVNTKCGAPGDAANDGTHQWERVFENMYKGPGLDGKQWLGVLGNHDYGGWLFTAGWDQAITYTWAGNKVATSTGRWMTPSQYYTVTVKYDGFDVDYFFADNNVFDSFHPDDQPHHNMCSREHNPEQGSTCGQTGPVNLDDCPGWFKRLWDAEVAWLNNALAGSVARWQIMVVHFPPEGAWGEDTWRNLGYTYGIDMIIAGHRHKQSFNYQFGNALYPTAVLVTGGGGGITSEYTPDAEGIDDQYGFGDLTLTANEIMVEMLSHSGQPRSTTCITPRPARSQSPEANPGVSMCEGKEPVGPKAHEPQKGDPSIAIEPGDEEESLAPAPYPAEAAPAEYPGAFAGRRLSEEHVI